MNLVNLIMILYILTLLSKIIFNIYSVQPICSLHKSLYYYDNNSEYEESEGVYFWNHKLSCHRASCFSNKKISHI